MRQQLFNKYRTIKINFGKKKPLADPCDIDLSIVRFI